MDVGLKKNPAIEEINVIEVCQELGVPFLVYTSSEDVVFSETPISGGDESLPYPLKPLHDGPDDRLGAHASDLLVIAGDAR